MCIRDSLQWVKGGLQLLSKVDAPGQKDLARPRPSGLDHLEQLAQASGGSPWHVAELARKPVVGPRGASPRGPETGEHSAGTEGRQRLLPLPQH
eukprot:3731040-Alexandrium_andersonii.AAC.1